MVPNQVVCASEYRFAPSPSFVACRASPLLATVTGARPAVPTVSLPRRQAPKSKITQTLSALSKGDVSTRCVTIGPRRSKRITII
jgi:hypothetical protein